MPDDGEGVIYGGPSPDFEAMYAYAARWIQLGDQLYEYWAHMSSGLDEANWSGDAGGSREHAWLAAIGLGRVLVEPTQGTQTPSACRLLWNVGESINIYADRLQQERAREQSESIKQAIIAALSLGLAVFGLPIGIIGDLTMILTQVLTWVARAFSGGVWLERLAGLTGMMADSVVTTVVMDEVATKIAGGITGLTSHTSNEELAQELGIAAGLGGIFVLGAGAASRFGGAGLAARPGGPQPSRVGTGRSGDYSPHSDTEGIHGAGTYDPHVSDASALAGGGSAKVSLGEHRPGGAKHLDLDAGPGHSQNSAEKVMPGRGNPQPDSPVAPKPHRLHDDAPNLRSTSARRSVDPQERDPATRQDAGPTRPVGHADAVPVTGLPRSGTSGSRGSVHQQQPDPVGPNHNGSPAAVADLPPVRLPAERHDSEPAPSDGWASTGDGGPAQRSEQVDGVSGRRTADTQGAVTAGPVSTHLDSAPGRVGHDRQTHVADGRPPVEVSTTRSAQPQPELARSADPDHGRTVPGSPSESGRPPGRGAEGTRNPEEQNAVTRYQAAQAEFHRADAAFRTEVRRSDAIGDIETMGRLARHRGAAQAGLADAEAGLERVGLTPGQIAPREATRPIPGHPEPGSHTRAQHDGPSPARTATADDGRQIPGADSGASRSSTASGRADSVSAPTRARDGVSGPPRGDAAPEGVSGHTGPSTGEASSPMSREADSDPGVSRVSPNRTDAPVAGDSGRGQSPTPEGSPENIFEPGRTPDPHQAVSAADDPRMKQFELKREEISSGIESRLRRQELLDRPEVLDRLDPQRDVGLSTADWHAVQHAEATFRHYPSTTNAEHLDSVRQSIGLDDTRWQQINTSQDLGPSPSRVKIFNDARQELGLEPVNPLRDARVVSSPDDYRLDQAIRTDPEFHEVRAAFHDAWMQHAGSADAVLAQRRLELSQWMSSGKELGRDLPSDITTEQMDDLWFAHDVDVNPDGALPRDQARREGPPPGDLSVSGVSGIWNRYVDAVRAGVLRIHLSPERLDAAHAPRPQTPPAQYPRLIEETSADLHRIFSAEAQLEKELPNALQRFDKVADNLRTARGQDDWTERISDGDVQRSRTVFIQQMRQKLYAQLRAEDIDPATFAPLSPQRELDHLLGTSDLRGQIEFQYYLGHEIQDLRIDFRQTLRHNGFDDQKFVDDPRAFLDELTRPRPGGDPEQHLAVLDDLEVPRVRSGTQHAAGVWDFARPTHELLNDVAERLRFEVGLGRALKKGGQDFAGLSRGARVPEDWVQVRADEMREDLAAAYHESHGADGNVRAWLDHEQAHEGRFGAGRTTQTVEEPGVSAAQWRLRMRHLMAESANTPAPTEGPRRVLGDHDRAVLAMERITPRFEAVSRLVREMPRDSALVDRSSTQSRLESSWDSIARSAHDLSDPNSARKDPGAMVAELAAFERELIQHRDTQPSPDWYAGEPAPGAIPVDTLLTHVREMKSALAGVTVTAAQAHDYFQDLPTLSQDSALGRTEELFSVAVVESVRADHRHQVAVLQEEYGRDVAAAYAEQLPGATAQTSRTDEMAPARPDDQPVRNRRPVVTSLTTEPVTESQALPTAAREEHTQASAAFEAQYESLHKRVEELDHLVARIDLSRPEGTPLRQMWEHLSRDLRRPPGLGPAPGPVLQQTARFEQALTTYRDERPNAIPVNAPADEQIWVVNQALERAHQLGAVLVPTVMGPARAAHQLSLMDASARDQALQQADALFATPVPRSIPEAQRATVAALVSSHGVVVASVLVRSLSDPVPSSGFNTESSSSAGRTATALHTPFDEDGLRSWAATLRADEQRKESGLVPACDTLLAAMQISLFADSSLPTNGHVRDRGAQDDLAVGTRRGERELLAGDRWDRLDSWTSLTAAVRSAGAGAIAFIRMLRPGTPGHALAMYHGDDHRLWWVDLQQADAETQVSLVGDLPDLGTEAGQLPSRSLLEVRVEVATKEGVRLPLDPQRTVVESASIGQALVDAPLVRDVGSLGMELENHLAVLDLNGLNPHDNKHEIARGPGIRLVTDVGTYYIQDGLGSLRHFSQSLGGERSRRHFLEFVSDPLDAPSEGDGDGDGAARDDYFQMVQRISEAVRRASQGELLSSVLGDFNLRFQPKARIITVGPSVRAGETFLTHVTVGVPLGAVADLLALAWSQSMPRVADQTVLVAGQSWGREVMSLFLHEHHGQAGRLTEIPSAVPALAELNGFAMTIYVQAHAWLRSWAKGGLQKNGGPVMARTDLQGYRSALPDSVQRFLHTYSTELIDRLAAALRSPESGLLDDWRSGPSNKSEPGDILWWGITGHPDQDGPSLTEYLESALRSDVPRVTQANMFRLSSDYSAVDMSRLMPKILFELRALKPLFTDLREAQARYQVIETQIDTFYRSAAVPARQSDLDADVRVVLQNPMTQHVLSRIQQVQDVNRRHERGPAVSAEAIRWALGRMVNPRSPATSMEPLRALLRQLRGEAYMFDEEQAVADFLRTILGDADTVSATTRIDFRAKSKALDQDTERLLGQFARDAREASRSIGAFEIHVETGGRSSDATIERRFTAIQRYLNQVFTTLRGAWSGQPAIWWHPREIRGNSARVQLQDTDTDQRAALVWMSPVPSAHLRTMGPFPGRRWIDAMRTVVESNQLNVLVATPDQTPVQYSQKLLNELRRDLADHPELSRPGVLITPLITPDLQHVARSHGMAAIAPVLGSHLTVRGEHWHAPNGWILITPSGSHIPLPEDFGPETFIGVLRQMQSTGWAQLSENNLPVGDLQPEAQLTAVPGRSGVYTLGTTALLSEPVRTSAAVIVVPVGYVAIILHGESGWPTVDGVRVSPVDWVARVAQGLRNSGLEFDGVILGGCTLGALPDGLAQASPVAQLLVDQLAAARPRPSSLSVVATTDVALVSHRTGRMATGRFTIDDLGIVRPSGTGGHGMRVFRSANPSVALMVDPQNVEPAFVELLEPTVSLVDWRVSLTVDPAVSRPPNSMIAGAVRTTSTIAPSQVLSRTQRDDLTIIAQMIVDQCVLSGSIHDVHVSMPLPPGRTSTAPGELPTRVLAELRRQLDVATAEYGIPRGWLSVPGQVMPGRGRPNEIEIHVSRSAHALKTWPGRSAQAPAMLAELLRLEQLKVSNGARIEMLGPDFFGHRQAPSPPEFLRAVRIDDVPTDRLEAFLTVLDLSRSATPAYPDVTTLLAATGQPASIIPIQLEETAREWVRDAHDSSLPPQHRVLSATMEVPKLVHSIWLGGTPPLEGFLEKVFRKSTNAHEAGWQAVLWTDISRADVEASRAETQDAYLLSVRNLLAAVRNARLLLVNVDEVFNSRTQLVLNEYQRSERAKRTAQGYTAASDILRLEIGRLLGGLYLDGDDDIESFDRLESNLSQSAVAIYGEITSDQSVYYGASAFAVARRHPWPEIKLNVIREKYQIPQYTIMAARKMTEESARQQVSKGGAVRRRTSFSRRTGTAATEQAVRLIAGGETKNTTRFLPFLEGITKGQANTWLKNERSIELPESLFGVRKLIARTDILAMAVATLVRDLNNRDGDLHLTAIEPLINELPESDRPSAWTAVIGFIRVHPQLARHVKTVTRRYLDSVEPSNPTRRPGTAPTVVLRALDLPRDARALLAQSAAFNERGSNWRLGEESVLVHRPKFSAVRGVEPTATDENVNAVSEWSLLGTDRQLPDVSMTAAVPDETEAGKGYVTGRSSILVRDTTLSAPERPLEPTPTMRLRGGMDGGSDDEAGDAAHDTINALTHKYHVLEAAPAGSPSEQQFAMSVEHQTVTGHADFLPGQQTPLLARGVAARIQSLFLSLSQAPPGTPTIGKSVQSLLAEVGRARTDAVLQDEADRLLRDSLHFGFWELPSQLPPTAGPLARRLLRLAVGLDSVSSEKPAALRLGLLVPGGASTDVTMQDRLLDLVRILLDIRTQGGLRELARVRESYERRRGAGSFSHLVHWISKETDGGAWAGYLRHLIGDDGGLDLRTLTPAEVQRLYEYLAAGGQIQDLARETLARLFQYPDDGCVVRAVQMDVNLAGLGIRSHRRIVLAQQGDLRMLSTNAAGATGTVPGLVEWADHVAVAVYVEVAGIEHELVLDPVMGQGPLGVDSWLRQMQVAPVKALWLADNAVLGALAWRTRDLDDQSSSSSGSSSSQSASAMGSTPDDDWDQTPEWAEMLGELVDAGRPAVLRMPRNFRLEMASSSSTVSPARNLLLDDVYLSSEPKAWQLHTRTAEWAAARALFRSLHDLITSGGLDRRAAAALISGHRGRTEVFGSTPILTAEAVLNGQPAASAGLTPLDRERAIEQVLHLRKLHEAAARMHGFDHADRLIRDLAHEVEMLPVPVSTGLAAPVTDREQIRQWFGPSRSAGVFTLADVSPSGVNVLRAAAAMPCRASTVSLVLHGERGWPMVGDVRVDPVALADAVADQLLPDLGAGRLQVGSQLRILLAGCELDERVVDEIGRSGLSTAEIVVNRVQDRLRLAGGGFSGVRVVAVASPDRIWVGTRTGRLFSGARVGTQPMAQGRLREIRPSTQSGVLPARQDFAPSEPADLRASATRSEPYWVQLGNDAVAVQQRPNRALKAGHDAVSAPKRATRMSLAGAELLTALRREEIDWNLDGWAPYLGPDFFGLMRPAPRPEFLRGVHTKELATEQIAAYFDFLDLATPGAVLEPRVHAHRFDARTMSRHSVVNTIWWGEDADPEWVRGVTALPDTLEFPRQFHAIWLGGPLAGSEQKRVFLSNLAELAGMAARHGYRVNLWTDVPRVDFLAVQQNSVSGRGLHQIPNNRDDVQEMFSWAVQNNIRLINVDEVFHSKEPMALHSAYQMERNKLQAAGYAAASDILRIEILIRFGGIYTDTDNVVTDETTRPRPGRHGSQPLWLDEITNALDRGNGWAGHRDGGENDVFNNSMLLSARNHPVFRAFQALSKQRYTMEQRSLNNDFRTNEASASANSIWALHPAKVARRTSILFRSGPYLFYSIARLAGLKASEFPYLTAVEMGWAGTWAPRSALVPSRSYSDADVLSVAMHSVGSLARQMKNRPGDLHLTTVAGAVAGLPRQWQDPVWEAMVEFIITKARVLGNINRVIDRMVVKTGDGQTTVERVVLPESVRQCLWLPPETVKVSTDVLMRGETARLARPVRWQDPTPTPIADIHVVLTENDTLADGGEKRLASFAHELARHANAVFATECRGDYPELSVLIEAGGTTGLLHRNVSDKIKLRADIVRHHLMPEVEIALKAFGIPARKVTYQIVPRRGADTVSTKMVRISLRMTASQWILRPQKTENRMIVVGLDGQSDLNEIIGKLAVPPDYLAVVLHASAGRPEHAGKYIDPESLANRVVEGFHDAIRKGTVLGEHPKGILLLGCGLANPRPLLKEKRPEPYLPEHILAGLSRISRPGGGEWRLMVSAADVFVSTRTGRVASGFTQTALGIRPTPSSDRPFLSFRTGRPPQPENPGLVTWVRSDDEGPFIRLGQVTREDAVVSVGRDSWGDSHRPDGQAASDKPAPVVLPEWLLGADPLVAVLLPIAHQALEPEHWVRFQTYLREEVENHGPATSVEVQTAETSRAALDPQSIAAAVAQGYRASGAPTTDPAQPVLAALGRLVQHEPAVRASAVTVLEQARDALGDSNFDHTMRTALLHGLAGEALVAQEQIGTVCRPAEPNQKLQWIDRYDALIRTHKDWGSVITLLLHHIVSCS